MAKQDNLMLSVVIGILATIFDQIYHIATDALHQFQFIFIPDAETIYYIGLKFFFTFCIAFIVLTLSKASAIQKSIIIAIGAATLFGVFLTLIVPTAYTTIIHLVHGVAMFLAAFIPLKSMENK